MSSILLSLTQYLDRANRAPCCEMRDRLQIWNQLTCYKLWYDLNLMSSQLLTRFSVAEKLTVVPQSHNVIKQTQFSSPVCKRKQPGFMQILCIYIHTTKHLHATSACYHAANICKACIRLSVWRRNVWPCRLCCTIKYMHICSTCFHFGEYLEDLVRKYSRQDADVVPHQQSCFKSLSEIKLTQNDLFCLWLWSCCVQASTQKQMCVFYLVRLSVSIRLCIHPALFLHLSFGPVK